MDDYTHLIQQLNLIVGFLDVSDEKIYHQIKGHDRFNLGITIEQLYDYNYENYCNHISSSAVLLGFAHLEDFISKCLIKILIKSPEKNDHKVKFVTIKEKKDDLVIFLAEQQCRQLTFSDKIKFLKQHLHITDELLLAEIRLFADARNCLMHNNGIADDRLLPKFKKGERIILNSGIVNGYGLSVRRFAEMIWSKTSAAINN